jgi:excisionase family DNA binding protein
MQISEKNSGLPFELLDQDENSSTSPSTELLDQVQTSSTSLPISERLFLRAKDAADLLSISKSHFHLLVREGVLPPGKLISGAVRVFKREELEEAAEQMWEGS